MATRSRSALRVSYLVLLYGGLAGVVLGNIFRESSGDEFSTFTLIYPGAAMLIAGVGCGCALLFGSWRCVELHTRQFDTKRRTLDPGAAIAMTVIPGVNFIGMFFPLGRLPGELNWLAKSAGLKRRVPDSLGYVAAAMVLCTLIPVVGRLVGLVAGMVPIPMLLVSCSALAESIESRLADQPAPLP